MDNNKDQSASNDAQSEGQPEEQKSGRTLDMQDISISTMKDDIQKDAPPPDKDGGWFGFMAKHKPAKNEKPGAGNEKNSVEETKIEGSLDTDKPVSNVAPELDDTKTDSSILDKELEEFKKTSGSSPQKPLSDDAGKTGISDTVEAPPNLPVLEKESDGNVHDESRTIKPSLSTYLPKSDTPEEALGSEGKEDPIKNKLAEALSSKMDAAKTTPLENVTDSSTDSDEDVALPDIQSKLREALSGESQKATVNTIKPVTEGGIAGGIVEPAIKTAPKDKEKDLVFENKPENKDSLAENPFAARIEPKEKESKSLLQSVEAALNYSAPPEFSKEREAQEAGGAKGEEGEGPVVDLRKKAATGPMALLANKKILIIGGGVIGLVIIIGVILMFVMGGKSTQTTKPQAAAPTENKNVNSAPPIKPIVTTPVPATLTPQKVLNNEQDVSIETPDDINSQLEKYRQGQSVRKQTQLIFLKSDGSSASFQELMNATGILVPRSILQQPSTEPALFFVDFFQGQTVFGLIIPSKQNNDAIVTNMKDWETTMVMDLDQLWKGITIDNKSAYFADSQLFKGGRFALIDKKLGLSLDYYVQNGYVLIAPGKDSMTILKNQFSPPADSSGGAGIKFEENTSSTVSGMESNSNENIVTGTNINVNSQ